MIAVLKHGTTQEQIDHLISWLKHLDIEVHMSEGKEVTILGLVGDTSRVDMELLCSLEMVSSVKRATLELNAPHRPVSEDTGTIAALFTSRATVYALFTSLTLPSAYWSISSSFSLY